MEKNGINFASVPLLTYVISSIMYVIKNKIKTKVSKIYIKKYYIREGHNYYEILTLMMK